ncbi:MAG: hypothetical protein KKE61_01830, partial [Proteobacteria bacterium]|nr:hypothetical protein [Pseudomonadota bacterium]
YWFVTENCCAITKSIYNTHCLWYSIKKRIDSDSPSFVQAFFFFWNWILLKSSRLSFCMV